MSASLVGVGWRSLVGLRAWCSSAAFGRRRGWLRCRWMRSCWIRPQERVRKRTVDTPRLDDVTKHAPVLLVDQRPELRKGVAILGAVDPLLAGNHIVERRHPDHDPIEVQLRGTSYELRV